jgi:hypothetical protein
MSRKKKKTAKDKKIKKEKNLKDSPAENLFTADWLALSLWSNKTLGKVSHPATSSDISRLTLLQGESGGTVNSTPTPVDTTFINSEIKSSDSSTTSENKDNKGKLANYLSAVSGSSPDGSTAERNRSETDSKYSCKYPSSGDQSLIPFDQDDTSMLLARILTLSSALPRKQITYTGAKMANYSPANFDANLEHIVTMILKLPLAHPLALALSQSFVNTFDDFQTIDIDDVHEFRYNMTTDPVHTPGIKLYVTVVKKIQRMVSYARFKEDSKDADCDTPNVWDTDIYSKWCRNGYAAYLTSLTVPLPGSNTAAIPNPVTSTTAAFVTTAQKDDDAALISWNRKPWDVAKYPLLKNDTDYQDWKLKIKRQLIADTLSRVKDPTFKVTNCRTGADMELAKLKVNFFEQILSAILLNSEGKGLIITHPEDALFVWKKTKPINSIPTLLKSAQQLWWIS